jgi:hypothetical protein
LAAPEPGDTAWIAARYTGGDMRHLRSLFVRANGMITAHPTGEQMHLDDIAEHAEPSHTEGRITT